MTMNCPHCDVPLAANHRQGVEIDVCPGCRGVWLDRGELDKIIERYDAYVPDDRWRDRPSEPQFRGNPEHPRRKPFWDEFFG